MKFKIENLEELNDSRQVMESKPHKFTSIFIYILLALIISFITWAWFSEKEVVVKVNGIVKPNEQSFVVSNQIAGEIKEVHMTNGQYVKKDEILYKTDDTLLQSQKSKLEEQKKYLTKDIENLNKLTKSIGENTNYFIQSEEEKEYYYKYKSYEAGNAVSIEDKSNLVDSKNDSVTKVKALETLSKSIDYNKNYNEEGSIYSEQFENYSISRKSIEEKINQLKYSKEKLLNYRDQLEKNKIEIDKIEDEVEKNTEKIKNKNDIKIIDEQISQIDIEIENNKIGLSKLQSDIKLQVKTSIDEINTQVKNIDNNVSKLNEGASLSKEKNKVSLIAQIEEKLNLNNEKLKEIDVNLKEIDENIRKCEVKSIIDGKLDIKVNLEPGVMIQTGQIVANILPKSDEYKIELIISDKDIANIKTGQEIKYSFNSLPYKEYGFLKGNIESISVTSQIDSESGVAYYVGVGTIENNVLYSNKGEQAIIKPGMTSEARVITRSKKMLYYLLEKLNLKD